MHKENLREKGTLNKILGTSSSFYSCIRVTMTPGVLVEAVEGMGGDWLRPVPPDTLSCWMEFSVKRVLPFQLLTSLLPPSLSTLGSAPCSSSGPRRG